MSVSGDSSRGGGRWLQQLSWGSLHLVGGFWVLQGDKSSAAMAKPALLCSGVLGWLVLFGRWLAGTGFHSLYRPPAALLQQGQGAGGSRSRSIRLCSPSPVHPRPCPCFIYLCFSRSIIQIKHGHKNVRESSNLFITHFTPIKISIKAAWF